MVGAWYQQEKLRHTFAWHIAQRQEAQLEQQSIRPQVFAAQIMVKMVVCSAPQKRTSDNAFHGNDEKCTILEQLYGEYHK